MGSAGQLHLTNASDRSYQAAIKREIHTLAFKGTFTKKRLAEIDIVVSEIVSNLSKHAVKGEMFVRLVTTEGIQGIEIIALDQGPGIDDIPRMMTDGVSTTNTLGNGLGSIRRLTNEFQIYSQKEWGTILYCTLYDKQLPQKQTQETINIKSIIVPKPNEEVCGDGFYLKVSRNYIKLFLGDGLGHGKEAHLSVQAAIDAFKRCPANSPLENLRFIHDSVKKTRGLVCTVAVLDRKELKWKICGVGNIQIRLVDGIAARSYVGYNGIIGLNVPNTLHDQVYNYEKGQTLIMCSDGIKSKWDLSGLPGILRHDPAILGGAIYKDFARGTDDISIVSCKIDLYVPRTGKDYAAK